MPINETITCTADYQQVGGGSVYAQGFVFIANGPVDVILQYGDATGQSQNVGFTGLEAGQYSLAQGAKYGIIGFQVRAAAGNVSSPAQTFQLVASEPNIPIIVPTGGGIGNPFSGTIEWQHNDVDVSSEPAADFEDSGTVTWTVTDDPVNGRVKISAASSAIPGGGTRTIPVRLDTPDAAGNAYPALTVFSAFANVRRIVPAFTKSVDGTWEGSVEVPADYLSGGTIILTWAVDATSGNLRNRVGSQVVANGVTLDGAYTQETYLNTTVPATVKQRFQTSFLLSTVLAAGSTLELQVTRNGSSGSDTLNVDALLMGCDLSYASAY